MMPSRHRIRPYLSVFLVSYFVFLFRVHTGTAVESPVPNLEASLVASSSRTTVIAVQRSAILQDPDALNDDSVLILSCSRFHTDSSSSEGLIRRPHISSKDEIVHCLHEPLGLTLVTTGLTSDTRYLVQTAKQYLTLLHYIYPTDSYHDSLATHKFVKDAIAQTLRRATEVRPLGVQTLIVGNNPTRHTAPGEGKAASLCIYTADPSGTWKHWGSGITCMGLYADTIRKQLHTNTCIKQDTTTNENNTWEQQGLDVALQAFLQALLLEDVDLSTLFCLGDSSYQQPHANLPDLLEGVSTSSPLVLDNGLHIQAMVVLGDVQAKQRGFRWAALSPSFIQKGLQAQIQKVTLPTSTQ